MEPGQSGLWAGSGCRRQPCPAVPFAAGSHPRQKEGPGPPRAPAARTGEAKRRRCGQLPVRQQRLPAGRRQQGQTGAHRRLLCRCKGPAHRAFAGCRLPGGPSHRPLFCALGPRSGIRLPPAAGGLGRFDEGRQPDLLLRRAPGCGGPRRPRRLAKPLRRRQFRRRRGYPLPGDRPPRAPCPAAPQHQGGRRGPAHRRGAGFLQRAGILLLRA